MPVTFHDPTNDEWWLEEDYYCLYLNQGLIWEHTYPDGTLEEDNIINADYKTLDVGIDISNSRSMTQSLTLRVDILDSNGIVHNFPERTIDIGGFSQQLAHFDSIDVSKILRARRPWLAWRTTDNYVIVALYQHF